MKQEQVERHITDAFARFRDGIEVPPIDPAREQALLAAFDAHWARPRPRVGRWVWAAAAASVVLAIVLSLPATKDEPATGGGPPSASESGGFVALPGAYALPPFESGELMRVDLPVSSLPALGIFTPPWSGTIVPAEILVGQDGLARAIRVLQE